MIPVRQAFSLFQRPLLASPRAAHPSFHPRSLSALTLPPSPRLFSVSAERPQKDTDAGASSPSESSATSPSPQTHIKLEAPEPRLSLTFTCTVESCHTRSTHQFTKRSYEKGIVLVECPGCKNRHLIADHLGWFKEATQDGKLRTVEDLLREKGEKVRRGRIDAGGVVEYAPE